MEIKKKTWPELFKKISEGKKTADVRLADFDLQEGDTIIFKEYDPKTKKYTGRKLIKKVNNLNKIKLTDFNDINEIIQYGHYLIELK